MPVLLNRRMYHQHSLQFVRKPQQELLLLRKSTLPARVLNQEIKIYFFPGNVLIKTYISLVFFLIMYTQNKTKSCF